MGVGRGVRRYTQVYVQLCIQPNLRVRNEHNLDRSPTPVFILLEQGAAAAI